MCFNIHKNFPEPEIAETDILVFKGGTDLYYYVNDDETFIPYYQTKFSYEKDNLNSKIELIVEKNILIEDIIEKGYHSYSRHFRVYRDLSADCPIGMFIIPQGTLFYFNPEDGEVVSEQLIYKGIYTEHKSKSLIKKGAKKLKSKAQCIK